MTMRKFITYLLGCLLPLAVGGASSLITGSAMRDFDQFVKPPFAPPGWLFPIAWTILYILMGLFSVRILNSDNESKRFILMIYIVQLVLNFFWTILFFSFQLRWFAFGELICLWLLIGMLIVMTMKFDKLTACLLVPYFLWCSFAMYLNAGIAVLN